MCSLFGLIDYSNTLPTAARKIILKGLSKECEIRGDRCNRHQLQHLRQSENTQKADKSLKIQFQTAI